MEITVNQLRRMHLPFSDYRVKNVLGAGTYGTVFSMENGQGELCALKVIPVPESEQAAQETLNRCGGDVQEALSILNMTLQRSLQREVSAAQKCQNCPYVFKVFETQVISDPKLPVMRYLLVRMELLTESRTYLRTPDRTQWDVVRMMYELSQGLVFLERAHIMHRDIKPANIMVDRRGTFKFTDFGEARETDYKAAMTMVGTPYYMAPEVQTKRYDHRADIYSLGMVGYYFLNKCRYPFVQQGFDPRSAYNKRMRGETCPPIDGVAHSLNRVILKCLAFHASDRYVNAQELSNDLARLLRDNSFRKVPLMAEARRSAAPTPSPEQPRTSLSPLAIAGIVTGGALLFILLAMIAVLTTLS